MSIEIIGVIAFLLGIYGLSQPPSFMVHLFMFATLLGAAAATNMSSVGGISISPAHLLLGFTAVRLLNDRSIFKNVIKKFEIGTPGFWLLLTTIYSLITSFFLPRWFAGQTFVFAVRASSADMTLLEPAMSNLTQSIYFIGDILCFAVISGFVSKESNQRTLGSIALGCATLNLVFAVIDLATYFSGTTELLSFIRNANYTLLNDNEVVGFKRIVGSFTEASSFAGTTLGYLAFTGRLWLLGCRTRLTLPLTLLSFLALMFSTSTTAYVGLGVLLAVTYLEILLRAFSGEITPQMTKFLLVTPAALALFVMVILFNDNFSATAKDLLDTMVFNKMQTASGVERAAWNRQALQSFFDTFGFGVGNGSVRASSFPVGVLASLGIIGSVLFGLFFLSMFLGGSRSNFTDPINAAYRSAAKSVCFAWLLSASISGSLIDMGLPFFAYAALASAQPVRATHRRALRVLSYQ